MLKMSMKAARVNRGFTQKEAAKLLKVSNKTLGSWEKGDSVPNIQKVQDMCNLYGVTYDQLDFLPRNPLKEE